MSVPIRLDAGSAPSVFQISDQQSAAQVLRLETGQMLSGRIIAGGENGTVRFSGSGFTFDLVLPEAVTLGTQIQLQVVSTEGAIQLQYIGQGAQSQASAGMVQSDVQVSSVSQWLSELMQVLSVSGVNENDLGGSAVANTDLQSLKPLNSNTDTVSVDVLANQLQNTIEKSGLFYEAHQAQWVQGHKTIEALLDEPQARWSPALGGAGASSVSDHNSLGIPNALIQNIEHQLGVLEHQTVQWQGQVWPGVGMSWYLHPMSADDVDDEDQQTSGYSEADQAQRPWMTHFDVHLPELGTVHAHLQVYQSHVSWYLKADKQDTQALLAQRHNEWLSALQARGITAAGHIAELPE